MSTEQQLLQAIAAAPGDDMPRLIYADWLEERGNPRGHFIRLGCRVNAGAKEYREFSNTYAGMWRGETEAWNKSLQGLGITVDTFDRGLPEQLHSTVAAFCEHFEKVVRLAPWVSRWRFSSLLHVEVEQLAQSPALRQLRSFDMSGESATWSLLANSRYANQIEELEVLGGSDEVAFAIAKGAWRRLRKLSFSGGNLTSAGLDALGDSGLHLKTLDVSHNDAGCKALATGDAFRQLESLDIGGGELDGNDIADLVAGDWPALQILYCGGNDYWPEGAGLRSLLGCTSMPKLHTLQLSYSRCGYEFEAGPPVQQGLPALKNLDMEDAAFTMTGIEVFASSGPVANVTNLSITCYEIEDYTPALVALENLKQVFIDRVYPSLTRLLLDGAFPHLKRLHVCNLIVSDAEARSLFEVLAQRGCDFRINQAELSDNLLPQYLAMPRRDPIISWTPRNSGAILTQETLIKMLALSQSRDIESIDFSGSGINQGHCKILANSPSLCNLKSLDLSYNGIGDRGVAFLACSPHLQSVQKLSLSNASITNEGVEWLLSSRFAEHLEFLNLDDNDIDDEGASALYASKNLPATATVSIRCENVSASLQQRN